MGRCTLGSMDSLRARGWRGAPRPHPRIVAAGVRSGRSRCGGSSVAHRRWCRARGSRAQRDGTRWHVPRVQSGARPVRLAGRRPRRCCRGRVARGALLAATAPLANDGTARQDFDPRHDKRGRDRGRSPAKNSTITTSSSPSAGEGPSARRRSPRRTRSQPWLPIRSCTRRRFVQIHRC